MLSFKATTYAVCPVFNILSAVNGYVMINNNFERNKPSFQFKPCTVFYKFPKGKKISTLGLKASGIINWAKYVDAEFCQTLHSGIKCRMLYICEYKL